VQTNNHQINKEVFKYLKAYSSNPTEVNRLIVSNFVYSNKLENTCNTHIKNLLIKPNSGLFKDVEAFLKIFKLLTIEDLIEVFEYVISPEDKVITGAIYTPQYIREFILTESLKSFSDYDSIRICDPACGCSGFLYTAGKALKEKTNKPYKEIFENNIFGLDIQKYAVERSKLLLTLFLIHEGEDSEEFIFNIFEGNALNFNWNKSIAKYIGFDAIVGNPPYVCSRNIDEESKALLEYWSTCSTGHPDLYIPFFEIALSNIKANGVIGFITMNTFFKSVNGRALRELLNQSKLNFTIIDFGSNQVFNSKSTYTCICLLNNNQTDFINFTRLESLNQLNYSKLNFTKVKYSALDNFNGWNLNEIETINKIETTGIPLGEKYKTRNGIATLKNNVFIFTPVHEDIDYYYLRNGELYAIEKGICTDIVNPNKLTKLNSINGIRQKIIFPYSYNKEQVKLIDELVFKQQYPKAYEYLNKKKDILATRDKGKGNYENWYAYGRNQSLEKLSNKLFFPHITSSIPNYVINQEENLLFYNGLALIANSKRELLLMKKIMSSRLFWYYIKNSSKPYGSGYYSLSRNYIKRFGVYEFSESEIDSIINEDNVEIINDFLEHKYGINLK
jgi:hypothetical protein